jgi:hypothetical protein
MESAGEGKSHMDHIPENPPGVPDRAIREAVSIPGYLLMGTGALVVLFWLFQLLSAVTGIGPTEIPPWLYDNPNAAQYRELLEQLMEAQAQAQAEGPGAGEILYSILGVGLGGLIAFGGLQMTKFRMYGLAIAASIVATIPCFSCCCCVIGLPVGIWALVVLSRQEVRAAFH